MLKVKRKILISLLAVTFTIIALGASTYAWFTLSNTNSLSEITLTVNTDINIDVSLDGSNWKKRLTTEDLKSSFENHNLTAVTTQNASAFQTLSGITISSGEMKYIRIPMWFRTTYIPNNVRLAGPALYLDSKLSDADFATQDGTGIISTGRDWTVDVTEFDYSDTDKRTNGQVNTYYAKDAFRIGSNAYEWSGTTAGTDFVPGTQKIFDLSDSTSVTRGFGYQYGAYEYYKIKTGNHGLALPTTIPTVVTELSTYGVGAQSGIAVNNNSMLAELTQYDSGTPADLSDDIYYCKVLITMWIEGWDGDCFDAIFNDDISVKMKFKIAGKHS